MRFRSAVFFLVCCAFALPASAQQITPFESVRQMVDEGLTMVSGNLFIEGFCTVMGGWGNVAHNENRYHSTVSGNNNSRTAYLENADASYGFCIRGTSSKLYKKLKMGDRLTVNLKGTTLEKTPTGMYVISGLDQANVLRTYAAGEKALPRKEKYISELTEADLCTFVTLKDCEFVFKDGAYINIYEVYAQKNSINSIAGPNGSMDDWASLLVDSRGGVVCNVCNSGAAWRRRGLGVPQGRGTVSGTLLADPMPRWSALPAGFQIRCMNETYYRMDAAPSAYSSIAEWNWNDGRAEFRTESGLKKVPGTSGIKADIGEGLVYNMAGGTVSRGEDFNNPKVEKKDAFGARGDKGRWFNGAMRITTPACNWWDWERNEGNGIRTEFSTASAKGSMMMFAFSFGAGDISPENAAFFPCWWKVQYSFDGVSYKDASGEICCRCTPWWWGRRIKDSNYSLSYECGLGYTEHVVMLPQECFGRQKVYVRVVPSRRNASTYSVTQSDKAAITKGLKKTTVVNFGSIAVRYK